MLGHMFSATDDSQNNNYSLYSESKLGITEYIQCMLSRISIAMNGEEMGKHPHPPPSHTHT